MPNGSRHRSRCALARKSRLHTIEVKYFTTKTVRNLSYPLKKQANYPTSKAKTFCRVQYEIKEKCRETQVIGHLQLHSVFWMWERPLLKQMKDRDRRNMGWPLGTTWHCTTMALNRWENLILTTLQISKNRHHNPERVHLQNLTVRILRPWEISKI